MITNIIFDLGNVLLNFKPRDFMLRFTEDTDRINIFISKVVGTETWLKLDRGVISLKEAKSYYISTIPEEKDLLHPFFDHCWEMLTPIEENVKILNELKENRYKLYILSNFIKEAFEYVTTKYKFFNLFDGEIISYRLKMIKPEKGIYEALINTYNLTPNECLFIDDHVNCLESAKKFGIHTILYNSQTILKEELQSFNIKVWSSSNT